MAVVNLKDFHLIGPRIYLDSRGHMFEKTASGAMKKVETTRTQAEDRYVERHKKGAKT